MAQADQQEPSPEHPPLTEPIGDAKTQEGQVPAVPGPVSGNASEPEPISNRPDDGLQQLGELSQIED